MFTVADPSSVSHPERHFSLTTDWLDRAEAELALALRNADNTDADVRVTLWLRGGLYSVRMARRSLAEAVS